VSYVGSIVHFEAERVNEALMPGLRLHLRAPLDPLQGVLEPLVAFMRSSAFV
jgi:hypothetical protein